MSTSQAAARLGLSPSHMTRLAAAGRIPRALKAWPRLIVGLELSQRDLMSRFKAISLPGEEQVARAYGF